MEPTEMKLKGPTESGSEEVVTLMHSRGEVGEAAATQEEHQQQQQNRGLKRSRRESRGSSAKERISKMPPCEAGKRSSIYRGVTRHRWTGRYEAHLWDKTTWNKTQNKKGKQVYLGAYDDEEAAARAYDLAALKYWGPGTLINFPVTDYSRDVDEMQAFSRVEYLVSLRRKSSGFSRGAAAKYRAAAGGSTIAAAAKHSPSARWEARIGRVLGNKYVYLGNPSSSYWAEESPSTSFEAATEYRGLNAVTNLDLTRYLRWLRPKQSTIPPDATHHEVDEESPKKRDEFSSSPPGGGGNQSPSEEYQSQAWPGDVSEPYQFPSLGLKPAPGTSAAAAACRSSSSSLSALSLLQQSSIYRTMRERASALSSPSEILEVVGMANVDSHIQYQATHQDCCYYNKDGNGAGGAPPEMYLHDHQNLHSDMGFPYSQAGGPPAIAAAAAAAATMPVVTTQDDGAIVICDSQDQAYWEPFVQHFGLQQLAT